MILFVKNVLNRQSIGTEIKFLVARMWEREAWGGTANGFGVFMKRVMEMFWN